MGTSAMPVRVHEPPDKALPPRHHDVEPFVVAPVLPPCAVLEPPRALSRSDTTPRCHLNKAPRVQHDHRSAYGGPARARSASRNGSATLPFIHSGSHSTTS